MSAFADSAVWLERYADVPAFLVDGLVPSSATLLYGEPMAGKSMLSVDLAAALTAGEEWLGRPVLGGPHNVGFVVTDPNGAAETARRWSARTGAPQGAPIAVLNPQDQDAWSALSADVVSEGITVLVLDNVLGAIAGDINSAKDVRALTDGLNLVLGQQTAVIAVHHSGKAGEHGPGRTPLGSQYLKAWPRSVLRLSARGGPDRRGLTTESNNAEPLDLTLDVEWIDGGQAARFSVETERAVNERSRERSKDTLDRNAEMAAFVVQHHRSNDRKAQVAQALAERFGGSQATYRGHLSRGSGFAVLLRWDGEAWTLRRPLRAVPMA